MSCDQFFPVMFGRGKAKSNSTNMKTPKAVWSEDETKHLIDCISDNLSSKDISNSGDFPQFTESQIQTKISTLKRNRDVDYILSDSLGPSKKKVFDVLSQHEKVKNEPAIIEKQTTPQKYSTHTLPVGNGTFPTITYSNKDHFLVFVPIFSGL